MKQIVCYLFMGILCMAVCHVAVELQPTLWTVDNISPQLFRWSWCLASLCMGLSLGRAVWCGNRTLLLPGMLQLTLGFLWMLCFAGQQCLRAAWLLLLLLDGLTLLYLLVAWRYNRWAMWLMWPCSMWLLGMTYLSGVSVWRPSCEGNLHEKRAQWEIFHLPKLPYATNALVPLFDEQSVAYHYDTLLRTELRRLNDRVTMTPYAQMSLEEIVCRARGSLRQHAARVWNHIFYFRMLSPTPQVPTPALEQRIDREFGSMAMLRTAFETNAREMVEGGWVWLVQQYGGQLAVVSGRGDYNPLPEGKRALLVLDVWEHAYYPAYRWNIETYVEQWWQHINWQLVERQLYLRGVHLCTANCQVEK